jgi:ubiquinone/menaquinone biosynthesis C-methylase UbiE
MYNNFYTKEKHPISKDLNLLISNLKKLKRIRGSNFFIMYFFLITFVKLHDTLRKNKTILKTYNLLIKSIIQEVKNITSGIDKFGFKKNQSNSKDFDTPQYYGNLFTKFSNWHYFVEPKKLLFERLKKNKINLKIFKNSNLIDYGCGNGRYTQALRNLRCKNIIGFDKSKKNISTARNNNKFKNINFIIGDVLKNKLPKNKFDIVYCNGVLHHTKSILLGLQNIHRILKINGHCLIMLVSTGGVKWAFIEAFREIFKKFDKIYAQNFLEFSGLDKNKVFYLMDHVFVKHNTLTSIKEVENLFKKANLKIVKKMNRGVGFDDTERIHKVKSILKKKHIYNLYGNGEHRYLLKKI